METKIDGDGTPIMETRTYISDMLRNSGYYSRLFPREMGKGHMTGDIVQNRANAATGTLYEDEICRYVSQAASRDHPLFFSPGQFIQSYDDESNIPTADVSQIDERGGRIEGVYDIDTNYPEQINDTDDNKKLDSIILNNITSYMNNIIKSYRKKSTTDHQQHR
jgi:hypothetical protein